MVERLSYNNNKSIGWRVSSGMGFNEIYYLKWDNVILGEIKNEEVIFDYDKNSVPSLVNTIVGDNNYWTKDQYVAFLRERVVSSTRRDIEKILNRLNMIKYDIIEISHKTHAINPKDMFWISSEKETGLTEAINGTFVNIFKHNINIQGSSIYSPDGQNEKAYGINNKSYGIIKKRLSPVITDTESEVAVYNIGKLLGVRVCPAWFVSPHEIFSKFTYDFSKEYLVHARSYFENKSPVGDLYKGLIELFPHMKDDIDRMCLLDFITRQDDRHLSNIGILNTASGTVLYDLYDNGRSLFYEDTEDMVEDSVADIINYSTTFGNIGTYYDVIEEIAKNRKISQLINLNIKECEIMQLLEESRFKGYRLDGSFEWIRKSLKILKEM